MLLKSNIKGEFERVSVEEIDAIIKKHSGFKEGKVPDQIIFHQHGKKDFSNKRVAFPASRNVLNQLTVRDTTTGEAVTYVYCETHTKKNINGVATDVFYPTNSRDLKLGFMGGAKTKTVSLVEKDKVAYLLLYPDNVDSPYRVQKKRGGFYHVYNEVADAEKIVEKEVLRITAEQKAIGMTIDEQRTYLSSKGIPGAHTIDQSVVVKQVIADAKNNPSEFLTRISDTKMTILGDIQRFVDKGLVYVKDYGGKRKEWRIGYGEQKGDLIVDIIPGETETAALLNYLLSSTGLYDNLRLAIAQSARVGKKEVEAVDQDPQDLTLRDKITKATLEGSVYFERDKKRVVFLDPETGNKPTEYNSLICAIGDKTKWREELEAYFTNNPEDEATQIFNKMFETQLV